MTKSGVSRILLGIAASLFVGFVVLSLPAPGQVAKPTVDLSIYRHVVQVGWVVTDLDSVADYWEMLGLKNIRRAGVMEFPNIIYHGHKTSLKMKMAFGDIGGVQIEWIQPVEGESVYSEFLKKHGDGVHHLAYLMPTAAVMDEQIQYFKKRGVGVVQSGTWKGTNGEGRFAYVDTAPEGGGITIELTHNPDWGPQGEAPGENEYPLTKIVQYALVVPDVHKIGAFWERMGFGGLDVVHNVMLDRVFRGEPAKYDMELGWGRAGDVPFEWIQPLVGPSLYDEYLKSRGEGFHHLAFNVKDMNEAIAHFKAKGVDVTQSGAWDINGDQGRFAYLDSDPHGGVTIELLWNRPRTP